MDEYQGKVLNFSQQLKRNRLPSYLTKDNLFLGKYLIKAVVPYTSIQDGNLLALDSVFAKPQRARDSQGFPSALISRRMSNLKVLEIKSSLNQSSVAKDSDSDYPNTGRDQL